MAFIDLIDRKSWNELTDDQKFEAFCALARAADEAIKVSQQTMNDLREMTENKINELYAAGVIVKNPA